jgi:uncharacterized membrane protein YcjF (UPF0283 family)
MAEEETETGKRQPRISWWKLGLGLLLLLGGLKNLGQRNIPVELMPSNETQWFGYFLATALFIVAGLFFMIAGLRHLWLNRPDR